MRQQKAPESLIKKILEQLDDVQTFEVWPENHIAVIIFLKLQTQWERNPLDNSMQSLKWGSVEIAMRREPGAKKLAEEEQDQLFSDITTMERHALSEIAKIKAENK